MRYEQILQKRLHSWEAELDSYYKTFSKELCLTNITKIKQELESLKRAPNIGEKNADERKTIRI